MKKYLLSLSLIIAFAFYAAFARANGGSATYVATTVDNSSNAKNQAMPLSDSSQTTFPVTTSVAKTVTSFETESEGNSDSYGEDAEENEDGTPVGKPVPVVSETQPITPVGTQPKPTPTPPVSTSVPTTPSPTPLGQYKDGTYTGPVADAYYGNIQVQAVISGGKLTDVIFLQYPSDRGTSVRINQQAMPYLKQEAIQAQSANVNTISGATDSSGAFRQSLGSALAQAKN